MKIPSMAKGWWVEKIEDSIHRRIMATMGLFIGVLGKLICFTASFSMIRKMVASMMNI